MLLVVVSWSVLLAASALALASSVAAPNCKKKEVARVNSGEDKPCHKYIETH